jgi:hypothetical protein
MGNAPPAMSTQPIPPAPSAAGDHHRPTFPF